ncbi:MAG: hypothetical protein WC718_14890, partial [Phycisphaerales bacterium]
MGQIMDRPSALVPIPDNIPIEMKIRLQWVLWRFLPPKDGDTKWRKVPFQLRGVPASTADPETWGAYSDTLAVYEQGGYDGPGYVFTNDDPYVSVDLDHAHDIKTRQLTTEAKALLLRLDTYAELSASGTGVH